MEPFFYIYPPPRTLEQLTKDYELGISYIIFESGDFTVITTEEYQALHLYNNAYLEKIHEIIIQLASRPFDIKLKFNKHLN